MNNCDPTPLSPAAQAVLDAVTAELDLDARYHSHEAAAAALRAVADQVAPPGPRADNCCIDKTIGIRTDLLAIADELENLQ